MLNHNDEFGFADVIEEMVSRRPLVYHMTNMVAIGEQANLALAIGASPIMSLYPGEAVELIISADSLVINIGTPSKEGIEAMFAATREARELGKPALLDPVGYGATKMRMDLVERLLDTKAFSVVKGNGAEISLLGGEVAQVRGVDSADSPRAALAAKFVARRYDCIAVATGPTDYVSDGKAVYSLKSGHEWLSLVSGSGCYVGTMIAACMTVAEPLIASMTALALMGAAAERAARESEGPGTFRPRLFDALYAYTRSPRSFTIPQWEKVDL